VARPCQASSGDSHNLIHPISVEGGAGMVTAWAACQAMPSARSIVAVVGSSPTGVPGRVQSRVPSLLASYRAQQGVAGLAVEVPVHELYVAHKPRRTSGCPARAAQRRGRCWAGGVPEIESSRPRSGVWTLYCSTTFT
jgi:hypothetical protein